MRIIGLNTMNPLANCSGKTVRMRGKFWTRSRRLIRDISKPGQAPQLSQIYRQGREWRRGASRRGRLLSGTGPTTALLTHPTMDY